MKFVYQKIIFTFFFAALLRFAVNAQLSVDTASLRPSQDTALQIKDALKRYFRVQATSAVHSRKSCNCGCDIRKESYLIGGSSEKFESYDFCDSQVFEWFSNEGDVDELSRDVKNILQNIGYSHLNNPEKLVTKFKTQRLSIEGPNVLTFLELNKKNTGQIHLKLSIATP